MLANLVLLFLCLIPIVIALGGGVIGMAAGYRDGGRLMFVISLLLFVTGVFGPGVLFIDTLRMLWKSVKALFEKKK